MPTVERRSLPQSLSAVAVKGRRLFGRDTLPPTSEESTRSPSQPRTSALNLNEALEQGWSATTSPHCLSNQLRSAGPSVTAHANSWGKDFGRRRSSNTTTASISSNGANSDVPQRRRKSLFSKKPRSEQQSLDDVATNAVLIPSSSFVDPFAHADDGRESRLDVPTNAFIEPKADLSHTSGIISRHRSSHRLSTQQQQQLKKREALDRVSDLVCLSVENQIQVPRSHVGASSPTFLTPSPTLCDNYFYLVEAPASPRSLSYSGDGNSSMIAFPIAEHAEGIQRLGSSMDTNDSGDLSSVASPSPSTLSANAETAMHEFQLDGEQEAAILHAGWSSMLSAADEFAGGQNRILLPCSMKRQPSRTIELDNSKRSSASLRAEIGHDFGIRLDPRPAPRCSTISQRMTDWSRFEDSQPSLPPPPPLRPLRSPLRNRSKSLSAATAAAERKAAGKTLPTVSSSPPPPLPSRETSKQEASVLVMPYQLTPVHTPPRSRRSSAGYARHRDRSDSWASADSSSSPQEAPFHTPTFGSTRWTTLPAS